MKNIVLIYLCLLVTGVVLEPSTVGDCASCSCRTVRSSLTAICTYKEIDKELDHIPNITKPIKVLELMGQPLKIMVTNAFSNITNEKNLMEINLKRCQIANIEPEAFKNLVNMIKLDLSFNNIKHVSRNTFQFNKCIRDIKLDNNQIDILERGLLANMTELRSVNLAYNKLFAIEIGTFNNTPKLKQVILTNNELQSLDTSFIDIFWKVQFLQLDNNPWKCDCFLLKIRDMILEKSSYSAIPTCAEPRSLENKNWKEVESEKFTCIPHIIIPEASVKVVSVGSNVTLPCSVIGMPGPLISWLNGSNAVEPKYLSLSKYEYTYFLNYTFEVKQHDGGSYSCYAKNSEGEQQVNLTLVVDDGQEREPDILEVFSSNMSPDTDKEMVTLYCKVFSKHQPNIAWKLRAHEENYINLTSVGSELNKNTFWQNATINITSKEDMYLCEASNHFGTVNSSLHFNIDTEFQLKASETIIYTKFGTREVTLQCTANSSLPLNITWSKDEIPLPIDENKYLERNIRLNTKEIIFQLTIKNISFNDYGTYICETRNMANTQRAKQLLHMDEIPSVTILPLRSIRRDKDVFVECTVYNNTDVDIQWYYKNVRINNANEGQYKVEQKKFENQGIFSSLQIRNINETNGGKVKCAIPEFNNYEEMYIDEINEVDVKPPVHNNKTNANIILKTVILTAIILLVVIMGACAYKVNLWEKIVSRLCTKAHVSNDDIPESHQPLQESPTDIRPSNV